MFTTLAVVSRKKVHKFLKFCVHKCLINPLSLSLSLSLSPSPPSMVTDHCTLQLKDRSSKRSHHKRFASQGDAPDIDTPLELSANLKTPPQKQKSSESQRSLDSKTVEKSSLGGGSIGPLFKAGSQTSVHKTDKTTPTTAKATPTTAELADKL